MQSATRQSRWEQVVLCRTTYLISLTEPNLPRTKTRCWHSNPPIGSYQSQQRESPPTSRHIRRCPGLDRKSTRLNSSHGYISYAVFCLKKKKKNKKKNYLRIRKDDRHYHMSASRNTIVSS